MAVFNYDLYLFKKCFDQYFDLYIFILWVNDKINDFDIYTIFKTCVSKYSGFSLRKPLLII